MVDLIEKERKEQQSKLDEIVRDNKRWRRKKTLSGVAAAALGVGVYFFGDGPESDVSNITKCALSSFLTYQLLTVQSAVLKSPLSILNPMTTFRAVGGLIRLALKGETVESEIKFRRRYSSRIESEDFIHRRTNKASIEILEGEEAGLEGLVDVFESEKISEKRENLVGRLFGKFFGNLAVRNARKKKDTPVRKILGEVGYYLSRGELSYAEQMIDLAVRNSKTAEDRISCLCVQGYFFESQGRPVEASNAFSEILGLLKGRGVVDFDEVTGTKNEVFVHRSPLLGRTFAFKTKKSPEDVFLEQKRTRFFHEKSSVFVKPLGIIYRDEKPYSSTRWAGRFGLNDYIIGGHEEEARRILGESLEAILLLHLRSEERLVEARRVFDSEHFGEALWRKFVERERLYGSAFNVVRNGVDALCEELEGVWRSVAHGDFHPGNIRVDREGKIYIIDAEDGIITSPYIDPVTLVENHLFRDMLTAEESLRALTRYSDNAVDSGALVSSELSMRYLHLTGAFKHLLSFGSAANFTGPDDFEVVRAHHIRKELAHLKALESFGVSDDLRGLKTCLGEVYCKA